MKIRALGITLLVLVAVQARAGLVVYPMDLAGFDTAAGDPPIAISFDAIAPGTNIDGATIAGVLFQPNGAPLIVVRGMDTYTPSGFLGAPDPSTNKLYPTSGENVLSPGGVVLGPGPDPSIESDNLLLTFQAPVAAFGFDHLSQSVDGYSFTSITVYNQFDQVLYNGTVPISNLGGGGAPGGADFWGTVANGGDLIKKIAINEYDDNNVYPDCNIGFDSFRFFAPALPPSVPEPATLSLLALAAAGAALIRTRRSRKD